MLNKIIKKILSEVDEDIRNLMLEKDGQYYCFELLNSPALTIIEWQRMRDEKCKLDKSNEKTTN